MFKIAFPNDGQKHPTETEVCLFFFMLAIVALFWICADLSNKIVENHKHIRNLATAVWQSAQREVMREERDKNRLKIPYIWNGPKNKDGGYY